MQARRSCFIFITWMLLLMLLQQPFSAGADHFRINVEYAPYVVLEYDASQIPAEWYGWLHYKTDLLPECDPARPHYKWMLEHTENLTGTPGQFMPYSTAKPKIHAWVPPRNKGKV